ncbi:MAG TPA: hypothetical protein VHB25_20300 [Gemmatimonadaceae bacterium]|nr:hypothetical protein [Gemmatimonadaceae bacterium]
MRRSLASRITAVLSSLLLVQLMLLASGTLCRMHAGHGDMMRDAGGHSGHVQRAAQAPHAAETMRVADTPAGMPNGPCGMNGSCGVPWAPGGGCASMGSCITALSALPTARAFAATVAPHAVAIVASAAAPRGPAFAPELPPPRA